MKIFNNFDTELIKNEYEDTVKVHGKEKVILVRRYMAFWILKGIIPLFFAIIINIFFIYGVSKIELETLPTILYFIIFILDILYLHKLFNLFLDYKFDHTIVTPKGITTYKQKGLFNSKLKDLPTSQIKSTQSFRSGLLGNIFSYGVIEILTDGGLGENNKDGSSQAGKTKLEYVHHPTTMRKKIAAITNVDKL